MRAGSHLRRGVAAVVAVLALGLSACSPQSEALAELPEQVTADFSSETTQEMEDAVARAAAAAGASGAIVGVWAPWSGQWVTAIGTQEPGGGGEVTTDLLFPAGRMTRAMTCDALYSLADAGVVSLKDSIADYVAGVADVKDVTLGQLCAGTSGIGPYTPSLMSMWLSVPDRVWSARELANYGLGQPRTSQPGMLYRDSDAGYVLLGLALERAAQQPLSQILRERVFSPAGLRVTVLPESGDVDTRGWLEGHHGTRDAEGVMNCTDPPRVTGLTSSFGYGDSGVVTDITDLGRYVQVLAAREGAAEGARFERPLAVYDGAPAWYTTTGGVVYAGSLVGQLGSVPGYATVAFADPESGLTVAVVLNNSANGAGIATALAWQLAAIASKAPAASEATAPPAGLPWTAEQYGDQITTSAICPIPVPEEPAAEEPAAEEPPAEEGGESSGE